MKAEEVSSGAEVKSREVSSGSVVVVGGPLGEGGAPSEKGGSIERERCCYCRAGFGATPKRSRVGNMFKWKSCRRLGERAKADWTPSPIIIV